MRKCQTSQMSYLEVVILSRIKDWILLTKQVKTSSTEICMAMTVLKYTRNPLSSYSKVILSRVALRAVKSFWRGIKAMLRWRDIVNHTLTRMLK